MMARKKTVKKSRKVQATPKKWYATPLKSSFMVIAILGFLITTYLIYPNNPDYGISFMLVFIAMFIASMISMTKAPVIE